MTTRRVHFPVQYNVCRILISPHTRKAKALIGDPSNPSNFKGARLTIQLPSSFFIALMSSPRFARFSTMTPPLPRNRSWNPKPFPPLVDPSARGVSSGLGVSMPTTEIPREIKFWAMEGQRYGWEKYARVSFRRKHHEVCINRIVSLFRSGGILEATASQGIFSLSSRPMSSRLTMQHSPRTLSIGSWPTWSPDS